MNKPPFDATSEPAKTTHFSCTMCGKCCHDLRLPLSAAESVSWLKRGGVVQIFCEAVPWPVEPALSDGPAQHKRRRSFAAMSGTQPIRVILTFVAAFDGPCPHLRDDMQCGAYEERPRVCRIYPAEVNPFVKLVPSSKACPPEAWTQDRPAFEQDGRVLDPATLNWIMQSRDTDSRDVPIKQRVATLLGCTAAAFSNEGFVIYMPEPGAVLKALETAVAGSASTANVEESSDWSFISNQRGTIDALVAIQSNVSLREPDAGSAYQYLAFYSSNTR